MGRKPMDGLTPKKHTVVIRLNEDELNTVKAVAETAGLSVSSWSRTELLKIAASGEAVAPKKSTPKKSKGQK